MNNDTTMPNHSLRRIIDFNFYPILGMDDSWWDAEWLPIPLFKQLRKNKVARRKLSDFILRNYQLESKSYFDFSSPEKQAALLSSADLKALLYKIGLIVESDTIANAIQKQAQQAIRKSLGEADYLYALKNRISMHHLRVYPKATSAEQQTPNFANFKSQLYQSGLRCLISLLADTPSGFVRRILLKLPKNWGDEIPLSENKDEYSEIRTCLPRLLKELKTS